jgi:hypothetical protein
VIKLAYASQALDHHLRRHHLIDLPRHKQAATQQRCARYVPPYSMGPAALRLTCMKPTSFRKSFGKNGIRGGSANSLTH